jgi:hypothetical protein
MENYKHFERRYRRTSWVMFAVLLIGIALVGSDWGVRAWLIGVGLAVSSALWSGITGVLLDRLDELEAKIKSQN